MGLIALSLTTVTYAQQTRDTRTNPGTNTSTSGSTGGSMNSTMGMSMNMEELDRMNKEGAAKVAAVTPTSAPLSRADQNLMKEVAMGGMMQLEISRIALEKASTDEVRKIAQAEVEEQTGLSNKLKEIAQAKGMTLPTEMDSKTQAMVSRMRNATGTSFDQMYLRESGVNGHKMLDQVMSRVEKNASDASMKELAAAAHPLVITHMQVSQSMLDNMKGSGTSKSR